MTRASAEKERDGVLLLLVFVSQGVSTFFRTRVYIFSLGVWRLGKVNAMCPQREQLRRCVEAGELCLVNMLEPT